MRGTGMAVCLLGLVSTACAAGSARAQSGDGAAALPGVIRLGVPVTEQRPVALAGSAGYGWTESQAGEGAHHRATGTLAASVGATKFLALALRLDGRYDRHPADARGNDDGWVGDPRLYASAGMPLSDSVRAGVTLVAWLPGHNAPSLAPAATTLDARAELAWSTHSGFLLAALAGFRVDNSGKSALPNAMLRSGDRLALGVSDFNTVLLGIGASQRVRDFELMAELTGDVLVGSGAPGFLQSPLRASAGARYHASEQLACELVLDASLSERPTLAPSSPHVPIEPRIGLQLGIRYRFGARSKPRAAQQRKNKPAPAPPPVVATVEPTQTGVLRGRVVDQDGAPVSGATLTLRAGGATREAHSAEDGTYALPDLPLGPAKLSVHGEGLEDSSREIEITAGEAQLDLPATRAPELGQIRGLVRSFAGTGLAARVEIEQLRVKTAADEHGNFELDVPPGQYEIRIDLPGYRSQRRSVAVETNGVTLLNVELRRGHGP